MTLVTLGDIEAAATVIHNVARTTPIESSRTVSQMADVEVFFKCENLQATGSFKIRGAYHFLHRLPAEPRALGVVAASAGNHAQGVALAARLLGIKATVFMPESAALPKVQATRGYGAEVVLTGHTFDEALEAAQAFTAETGKVFVPPFDHLDVIAGQGTIALEIAAACPQVRTVLVPIGGGGLISGIAAGIKQLRPACRVVGVEASGAAAALASIKAGGPVTLPSVQTFCDGIAVKHPSELTYAHMATFVDQIVTVDDEATSKALLLLLERAKLLVEPSGAVGVAALIEHVVDDSPGPVVVVLSGGNVDPLLLLRLIRYGLASAGRYLNFITVIDDQPGALHRLLGILAELEANVLNVEHHRTGQAVPMQKVEVALSVETRDSQQARELMAALRQAGFPIYSGASRAGR